MRCEHKRAMRLFLVCVLWISMRPLISEGKLVRTAPAQSGGHNYTANRPSVLLKNMLLFLKEKSAFKKPLKS